MQALLQVYKLWTIILKYFIIITYLLGGIIPSRPPYIILKQSRAKKLILHTHVFSGYRYNNK